MFHPQDILDHLLTDPHELTAKDLLYCVVTTWDPQEDVEPLDNAVCWQRREGWLYCLIHADQRQARPDEALMLGLIDVQEHQIITTRLADQAHIRSTQR